MQSIRDQLNHLELSMKALREELLPAFYIEVIVIVLMIFVNDFINTLMVIFFIVMLIVLAYAFYSLYKKDALTKLIKILELAHLLFDLIAFLDKVGQFGLKKDASLKNFIEIQNLLDDFAMQEQQLYAKILFTVTTAKQNVYEVVSTMRTQGKWTEFQLYVLNNIHHNASVKDIDKHLKSGIDSKYKYLKNMFQFILGNWNGAVDLSRAIDNCQLKVAGDKLILNRFGTKL